MTGILITMPFGITSEPLTYWYIIAVPLALFLVEADVIRYTVAPRESALSRRTDSSSLKVSAFPETIPVLFNFSACNPDTGSAAKAVLNMEENTAEKIITFTLNTISSSQFHFTNLLQPYVETNALKNQCSSSNDSNNRSAQSYRCAVCYRVRDPRQPGRRATGGQKSQKRSVDAVAVRLDTTADVHAVAPLGYSEGVHLSAEAMGCPERILPQWLGGARQ